MNKRWSSFPLKWLGWLLHQLNLSLKVMILSSSSDYLIIWRSFTKFWNKQQSKKTKDSMQSSLCTWGKHSHLLYHEVHQWGKRLAQPSKAPLTPLPVDPRPWKYFGYKPKKHETKHKKNNPLAMHLLFRHQIKPSQSVFHQPRYSQERELTSETKIIYYILFSRLHTPQNRS